MNIRYEPLARDVNQQLNSGHTESERRGAESLTFDQQHMMVVKDEPMTPEAEGLLIEEREEKRKKKIERLLRKSMKIQLKLKATNEEESCLAHSNHEYNIERVTARASEIAHLNTMDIVDLHFHGKVSIESRDTARAVAEEACRSADAEDLVYFVDGSVRLFNNKEGHGARSTASVVHKTSVGTWASTAFAVSHTCLELAKRSEEAGIAGALTVAAHETKRRHNCASLPSVRQVQIFSDSQTALRKMQSRHYAFPVSRDRDGDDIGRKIVVHSHTLQQSGVRTLLHWVPGHSGIEGNVRADRAARKMMKHGIERPIRHARTLDVHPVASSACLEPGAHTRQADTSAETTLSHERDKIGRASDRLKNLTKRRVRRIPGTCTVQTHTAALAQAIGTPDATKRQIMMESDHGQACYVFADRESIPPHQNQPDACKQAIHLPDVRRRKIMMRWDAQEQCYVFSEMENNGGIVETAEQYDSHVRCYEAMQRLEKLG